MNNKRLAWIVFILLMITIVLSVCGYMSHYKYAFDTALYETLKLFVVGANNKPEACLAVNIARFLAPIIVIYGVAQLVFFISQNGWKDLCLWTFRKHTIICGYGDTGKTIVSQLEGMGEKRLIIIDPLLVTPKVSFSKIFIKRSATDETVLEKEAKIERASKIIIATGNDYANTQIFELAKKINKSVSVVMRLEQFKGPIVTNNCHFFNLSDIVAERFAQLDDKSIIVLGIGNIGERIVAKYKDDHDILVIEQSEFAIHMAKDRFGGSFIKLPADFSGDYYGPTNNSSTQPAPNIANDADNSNIKYLRANVKGLVESDLKNILEYNKFNSEKVALFICLGGDWLGVYTALNWLSWKKIKFNTKLIGIDINKGLFDTTNQGLLKDIGKNSISVYNINEIVKEYCENNKERLFQNG